MRESAGGKRCVSGSRSPGGSRITPRSAIRDNGNIRIPSLFSFLPLGFNISADGFQRPNKAEPRKQGTAAELAKKQGRTR